MLLFGREVSTPLDLMYELPELIKPVPNNHWVWELRDKIESAHNLVRQNTQQAMHRQKRLRDTRISYDQFKVGDQVFVYFPVKKIGTSSKLTPFWKGPFQITGKLSDILYKVNCGQNRTDQIIHCDRIKRCREQILRGEAEQTDLDPHSDDSNHNNDPIDEHEPVTEDESETEIEQNEDSGNCNVRKRPFWAKDYVFFCRMVNTKQTPRKMNPSDKTPPAKTKCTWCKGLFEKGQKFEQHMVTCYRSRWDCHTCGRTFAKHAYLRKHRLTQHNVRSFSDIAKNVKKASSTVVFQSGDKKDGEESDWNASPDVVIGDEENSDGESVAGIEDKVVEKTATLPLNLESDDEMVKEVNEQVGSRDIDTHTATDKSEKESDLSRLKGRLFRKSTEPQRPINPIKRPRISASPTFVSTIPKDQPQIKVKEFLVKCKRNEQDSSSQQEVIVQEDGEEIYRNSVERKRQRKESMMVNIGELLPEGSVSISDIQLKLEKGAEIKFKLKYSPQDD